MSVYRTSISLVSLLLLFGSAPDSLAIDGFPIRVTQDSAPIQIGTRTVGKAKSNTLLWATKFSEDNKWVSVKVPDADRRGWMSVNHAVHLEIPDEREESWQDAVDYGARWNKLMADNKLSKAAIDAEKAAVAMERILTEITGPLTVGYPPAGVAYNQAGVARLRGGELPEAQVLFEKAVAIATTSLGSQHVSTCISQANLGEVHVLRGKWTEGITAFERSMPTLEASPPEGVYMESYYVRYATALANQSRVFDARTMYDKALATVENKQGKFAQSIAEIASMYATMLDTAGHRKDAVEQLKRARLVYLNHVEKHSPLMMDVLNRLAAISARSGDYSVAATYAQEAIDTHDSLDNPQPLRLGSSFNNLGLAQARMGNYAEAAASLAEGSRLINESTEADSGLRSYPIKNQGILAMEQGQLDRAEEWFRQALSIRQNATGDNQIPVAEVSSLLGQVALLDGRIDEAQSLLRSAVESLARRIGIDHPDCRIAIQHLQGALANDEAGLADLDRFIDESRRDHRRIILGETAAPTTSLDSIADDYSLERVLADRMKTPPETNFFAIEVTSNNAPIRSEGRVIANLQRGAIVYGLRAEGNRGLVKVPDQEAIGWVSGNHVRDVVYSSQTRQRINNADNKLNEAWEVHTAGNSKKAATMVRQVLDTYESELGAGTAWAGTIRYTLGTILASDGQINEAIEQCRMAESILVRTLGSDHGETAMARNNLSHALGVAGLWKEGLQPGYQSMRVFLAMGPERRNDVALIAGNMGAMMGLISCYDQSLEFLQYSLKASREAHGEEHALTARAYTTLGKLYSQLGDYQAAESAIKKGYDIFRAVSGPNHPDTTDAMQRYGAALIDNLQIEVGRQLIESAVSINHRERGPNDLTTIDSDFTLANLLVAVGDTDSAAVKLRSVIERATQQLGSHHPTTLYYRYSLIKTLYADRKFKDALSEAEAVLALRIEHLGEANHDTIEAWNGVGVCNASLGNLNAARHAYERAMQLATATLGPDHPDIRAYHYNIGEAAWLSGDYATAIPRIQRTINRSRAENYLELQESFLALTRLGYISVAQNDARAASRQFDEAAHAAFEHLSQVLPALAEKEQLSYLTSEFRDTLHGWLSLLTAFPNDPDVVSRTATWHLNMKSSSHELLATQAKLSQQTLKGDRPAFQQLLRVREQLARLALKGDNTGPQHKTEVEQLSAEESRLSRQLGQEATALADPRRWIELSDVRAHIPEQSVLVDFARIRQANFHPTSSLDLWNEERYLAWIIPSADAGDVIGLDLGPASEIDQLIQSALQASCSPATLKMVYSDGESSAEQLTRSTLAELATVIWKPLQEHVQGIENLVISPDGQLWTIPWEALPVSENRVLLEDHTVRLVVSGRDIMPKASSAGNAITVSAPVIIADPLFDLAPTSIETARTTTPSRKLRSANQDLSRVFRNAGRLPGTAQEAEAIRDSVSRFAGHEPVVHLQQSAQEGVVKNVHNPHCMVLSTHGFFIAGNSDSEETDKLNSGSRVIENPLLRCGLLLAGCQHADQVPQGSDDGVLTGLEIISTNLHQTQLVVLSACETGLGDVRNGEGIAGLRQAFLLAGSESVVASLWKVDDTATARLMDEFFRNLAAGMSRSAALREAKLSRIRARRERHGAAHPFYWAAFTLTGKE